MDEDVDHMILDCTEVQSFWSKIVSWSGVYGPLPIVIMEHATQFCNVFLFGKEAGIRLQVIWLASCWYIWKEHNRVFALKNISIDALVDKVKVLSWWWLESRKKVFNYMLLMWLTNHLACLEITNRYLVV
jgi:hypothetical protein